MILPSTKILFLFLQQNNTINDQMETHTEENSRATEDDIKMYPNQIVDCVSNISDDIITVSWKIRFMVYTLTSLFVCRLLHNLQPGDKKRRRSRR